jgi:hypothetical protein
MIGKPVPPAQPKKKKKKKKKESFTWKTNHSSATKPDHATTKTKSSLKPTPGKPSLEEEQDSQPDEDDDTGIKQVRSVITIA